MLNKSKKSCSISRNSVYCKIEKDNAQISRDFSSDVEFTDAGGADKAITVALKHPDLFVKEIFKPANPSEGPAHAFTNTRGYGVGAQHDLVPGTMFLLINRLVVAKMLYNSILEVTMLPQA